MKKLLFVFPILVLLGAGCNYSKNVSVQTQTVKEQSPSPTATTSPAEQQGWLTYSYQNFSFKYPSVYTVEVQNKGSAGEFLTIRNQDLWIEIDYSDVNPSLDSSDITKYISALMVNNKYTHYDLNTPVAGQKTVHIAESGSMQTYDYDDYSFLKEGKYYRLDFSYHSNKATDEKIRDTFIQNFKFNVN